ncbi:MAG: hypothetical protein JJU22_11480 [Gammaproteobacteria bacterium]|nr:hypothetical protein [Gammaproteobacteria bacterium]
MARIWSTVCLLILGLALAGTALAQSALDRDTITRWIEAAKDVQAWADTQDEEDLDDDLFDFDGLPTFDDIERAYSEIYRRDSDVRGMIRERGFRSADEWGNISARITMGMVSLEMGDVQPEMDSEMARAMREMENNPNVPPQMREMMRQQMQQAMGGMERMTEGVREDDLPALREMRGELREIIDVGEQ